MKTQDVDLQFIVLTLVQRQSVANEWEVLLRRDVDYDVANNCQIITYSRICSQVNAALACEIATNWLISLYPHDYIRVRGAGNGNIRNIFHINDDTFMGTQFPILIVRNNSDLNHDTAQFRWRGFEFEEIL